MGRAVVYWEMVGWFADGGVGSGVDYLWRWVGRMGCEVGLLLIWTVEKRVFFAWTEECRNAIQLLQECITTALVLA